MVPRLGNGRKVKEPLPKLNLGGEGGPGMTPSPDGLTLVPFLGEENPNFGATESETSSSTEENPLKRVPHVALQAQFGVEEKMQKLSLGVICEKGTGLTLGIGTEVGNTKETPKVVDANPTLKIVKKPNLLGYG